MKKLVLYLKHILLTALAVTIIAIIVLLATGNSMKYKRNYAIHEYGMNNEGPVIMYEEDSVKVAVVHGSEDQGYEVQFDFYQKQDTVQASVFYFPDSTIFSVSIVPSVIPATPPTNYAMPDKIFVVSDIEGGFASFRKLLIANGVVDTNLNWTYDEGHLVLLGDFVDRGYFVNQVLYLVVRLEQQAQQKGGAVHFVLGNHELMNMQGFHDYAAGKYAGIASLAGLTHQQMYGQGTYLGKWLHSKNIVEKIGDIMFVHGGFHPDWAKQELSLDSINKRARDYYGKPFVPVKGSDLALNKLLHSSTNSPYWYRGYFTGECSQSGIDSLLTRFSATQIVTGHTVQSHVTTKFNGKVVAIDVKHPQEEWGAYLPAVQSEGLLIESGVLYRVNDEGEKKRLY